MMTDKHPSIMLSFIMTAIVFSLAGLSVYAKTVALIVPSIAAVCLIWAATIFLSPKPVGRSAIQGRAIVLIFTAYIAWFICLTGGTFSLGSCFFIFVMASAVLFDDLPGFFISCWICAALLAFFYFGPSWGPGALNLNKFRLVFFIILFSGIGSVLFLIFIKQQALVDEKQTLISVQQTLISAQQTLITEKQAAVELSEKVQEDAHNAIEVKDRFLANMSHEIRNPMNGVLGMIHVLLDSRLDAEQRRHADIAYNSAKALLTIVNDILDLSKIEAGKIELDIRPFDLEIAIKDIVSLPALQARQKGLDFVYNIDTDVARLLKGDIGRVRQVILNFTSNAIKFTESGSVTLNVTLKEDKDDHARIHFSVDDTGIGIDDEVLKGLFTPFVQADSSITKKFGGTGLGLSISKLFIELMGGQVGADSIEMIGSTFWFEAPFEKQSPEEMAPDLSSTPMNEIRVIAVSDDSEPSTRVTKVLEQIGFIYETCEHSRVIERVSLANEGATPFHVVIMEVSESDQYAKNIGLEFSQKPEFNALACIIVTAVGKKGDAREFEALGFSAFLSYPIDETILQDALRTVLSPNYQKSNMAIITRYALAERRKRAFKILIVDDIETNVLTAKAIIGKQGYQTDSAANGIQAVEKTKNNKFDLIFMDCQMPEMDGYEASRQIRAYEESEKLSETPIIAMTGNAFEKDRQTCIAAGMNDFISKPVNPQSLIDLIEAYKSGNMDSMALEPQKDDLLDIGMPEIDINDDEKKEQPPASMDANDGPVPVFDRAGFLERFGNDEELAAEVLEAFLQEVEELVNNLVSAITKEPFDYEYLKACAHALKGAAANVNAEQLRHMALDIETQADNDVQLDTLAVLEMIKKYLDRFNSEALL